MATADRALSRSTLSDLPPRVIDLTDAADVISIDEVARRLDIPKATLYQWRYKGTGPRSHRIGRYLRYRWSDVLDWLDNHD